MKVFVMISSGAQYNSLWLYVRSAIARVSAEVITQMDLPRDENVFKKATALAKTCDAIIVEVTGKQNDLSYEETLTDAYKKPIMLLIEKAQKKGNPKIPHIFYDKDHWNGSLTIPLTNFLENLMLLYIEWS